MGIADVSREQKTNSYHSQCLRLNSLLMWVLRVLMMTLYNRNVTKKIRQVPRFACYSPATALKFFVVVQLPPDRRTKPARLGVHAG